MAWCGLEGHDEIVERFRRSLRAGRLASSYLFVGPPGIGKKSFALRLAQAMLCQRHDAMLLAPCQECDACQQVDAQTHPDVDIVARPEGKSFIPIELFIGDRDHRSREGLCHRISLRPSSGRRRVAIIDDSDWLNPEGANSLLKTLEEPPPHAVLILIGTSLQRQLPTIRSRCQVVRFQPLDFQIVERQILAAGICDDPDDARQLAMLSEGSLERAREFGDVELRTFSDAIRKRWSQPVPDTVAMAKEIQTFVDAAGRDSPSRRARLRRLIQLTIQHLRAELQGLIQATPKDHEYQRSLDVAERRIDRCLVALQQIDANANLATLIECWVDDYGQAFFLRHGQHRTGGPHIVRSRR